MKQISGSRAIGDQFSGPSPSVSPVSTDVPPSLLRHAVTAQDFGSPLGSPPGKALEHGKADPCHRVNIWKSWVRNIGSLHEIWFHTRKAIYFLRGMGLGRKTQLIRPPIGPSDPGLGSRWGAFPAAPQTAWRKRRRGRVSTEPMASKMNHLW